MGQPGRWAFLFVLLVVSAAGLAAQDSTAGQDSTQIDARQIYLKLCSGCHGADARGSQQAPGLSQNANLRGQSVEKLHQVIRNGVPAAGMPAFNLPDNQLDALAALIVSLNASAAQAAVAGDRAAGEKYFFGAGGCASCHMVFGKGQPVGPDLSETGKQNTVDQIREALVKPAAQTTPGYELVTVRLRNGQTLRGFARSRTNFVLELVDLEGGFHSIAADAIAGIDQQDKPLMPVFSGTADELENVVAYLSGLTGIPVGALSDAKPAGGDDFAKILHAAAGDWPTYNGQLSGNRYSDLKEINAGNVGRLRVKWTFSIPLWQQFLPDTPYFRENMRYFGLETVPVVVGGTMYVTGPNEVFALDARTGQEIWHYARPRTPKLVSDPSLGTNRGVAVLGDRIFMVTDNAHLIALNRITGRPMWEVTMPDEAQHYGGTMAPLVVKDMVIAGVSGGDWGIRGFVAAYRAESGERVWRRWTVPSSGEPGIETWKGTAVKYGGGATWLTGSYDAETDTLYWGTGNPFPDSDDRERGGDNLYTDSVLALDPATGAMKWTYQFTPHDVHDWDSTVPNVVVDTEYKGRQRKLLLHADRNGFFYVFDRTSGELMTSHPFIRRVTWASRIDAAGRPVRLPETNETCPEAATNWNGTAYDPATRLYYVMALEKCDYKLSAAEKAQKAARDPGKRYLRAINIDTGEIAWEIPEYGPTDGKRIAGVLATAGGLLFYGDPGGEFVAVDDRNGKPLWHIPLNAIFKTSPVSFAVDGEQMVTIAVGSNIVCFGLGQ